MGREFTTTTEINNKYNIKFYYEIDETTNKVNILDSSENYFNDMYYDADDKDDIKAIINMLEKTDLEEMCNFFNANVYASAKELIEKEELNETEESVLDNDYVNRFIVGEKTYYTWSN
jgi:hypothetical protein